MTKSTGEFNGGTYPVNITEVPTLVAMMIQTDPPIYEPEIPMEPTALDTASFENIFEN